MFPNWAKNILFLLVFMISGLVLALIIDGLLSGAELIPLNTAVEHAIAGMRTPFLTNIFVLVAKLGNPFVLTFATAFIAIILVVRGYRYDAALFVITLTLSIIALVILKNTFQITRPNPIIAVDGWSFPSGHATVATAFFFMLVHSFWGKIKTSSNKAALVFASFAGAILIWFSRLYLGAHWMLDVLAGIALGLLCVSFTVLVFNIFIESRRSLKDRIS